MKLVFATMIRTADRWCPVSISYLERHQLRLLRAERGLDPSRAPAAILLALGILSPPARLGTCREDGGSVSCPHFLRNRPCEGAL